MTDRPRCYIAHGVVVSGWPALFLGMPRVRRALQAELDELPHRLPHAEVVDVLEACRLAGEAWIAGARQRQSETAQSEAEVSSEHGDELTTSEAASVMNRSPRRIRQMAASGELPARRVGARWRFNLATIEGRLRGE